MTHHKLKMVGTSAVDTIIANGALMSGEHVHRMYVNDEMCLGGDPECPLWGVQLAEALEVWS